MRKILAMKILFPITIISIAVIYFVFSTSTAWTKMQVRVEGEKAYKKGWDEATKQYENKYAEGYHAAIEQFGCGYKNIEINSVLTPSDVNSFSKNK